MFLEKILNSEKPTLSVSQISLDEVKLQFEDSTLVSKPEKSFSILEKIMQLK
jgi:hypothetical protein